MFGKYIYFFTTKIVSSCAESQEAIKRKKRRGQYNNAAIVIKIWDQPQKKNTNPSFLRPASKREK